MSIDAQSNAGAAGELTGVDDIELPRADAADGLAQGALIDAAEPSVARLPRIAQALRHRDFRLFWTGNFLSNIGTWMQNVAQGWLVLQLTNSAFWLGVVGFASSIPILFFALIGGVIADNMNKRKLLMMTQSAMMVFAFILSALAYSKKIDVHEIVLLALGTGIAMSLNTPTYQAIVPQLVPKEDLTNAIALNSAQFNMSRVVGPTLGGFAMSLFGVAGNFFLNGLSFLAVIIALSQIRSNQRGAAGEGHLWHKLKQGFDYVFSRREMLSLIMVIGIGSLLAIPFITFVPYFARDVLHAGERGLGILMACSGSGAFLGAATIAHRGRMQRPGLFVLCTGLASFVGIVVFTFSRSFYFSGALLVVIGYCMILMIATINSLLQHLAEDHMRGRVMSIYSTAFLGLPPIGCLIAGSLAHLFNAPHAIAGMAALAGVGVSIVFVTRKELRQLE
ncbi:MAG TPA: MFS transporter [Candidatus Angelobacter sp.]|nr:MFS transporter [Candidatus Angelobacter sp.]